MRSSRKTLPTAFPDIWPQLEKSLVGLIFGSNRIDSAGTSLQITTRLCQDVFRGKEAILDIDDQDHSYRDHIQELAAANRRAYRANVIRSRKEVVFHAKALDFMIDRIILNDEPWSEELIGQTHRILYMDLGDDDDATPSTYRQHEVADSYGDGTRRSICIGSSAVQPHMAQMVDDLNNELAKAEASDNVDPYTLAARYHHHFMMIHPFRDGNGRMSRIVMNVLLLKYAGYVSLFGSEKREKHDYMEILHRGQKDFNQEDTKAEIQDQTYVQVFTRFILAHSVPSLGVAWSWASWVKEKGASRP